ncbi:hypothetical protein L3C95_11655 [Chitinophaga filiformis]|uniref:hypothetical protein n=1 Tax=Chitinophaga filiformis TaxID=104663 RepID=UPI001F1A1DE6|nr:hypothetical protein [Chitinophaga filiformis]MCF6402547.1 hypothetical protein [Chitinophaga filiformis]MCF6403535.1 hypothetical protein [Chitinophaga filiformis]
MKTTLFVIAAFLFSNAIFAQQATVKTTQSATVGTNSVNGTMSGQTHAQADVKSGNVKTASTGAANASTGVNTKNSTAIAAQDKTNISAAATEHADVLKNSVNSASGVTVKSTQNTTTAVNSDIKENAVGTSNVAVKSTQNAATAVNNDIKQTAAGTINTTVKSTQNVGTAVNSEIKQTTVGTTNATVKSTQHIATNVNSDIKQTAVGTKAAVKSVDAGVKNHTKIAASSSIKAAGAVHNTVKVPSIKTATHVGANMKVGLR